MELVASLFTYLDGKSELPSKLVVIEGVFIVDTGVSIVVSSLKSPVVENGLFVV